jgi:peptidoglycan glycosyltransferase
VNVVKNGTGKSASIIGVDVAGKTGTAETTEGKPPHAWFVAFAPAQTAKVAVAVVVEDGGNLGNEATGGRLSAPIAKAVMEAILK